MGLLRERFPLRDGSCCAQGADLTGIERGASRTVNAVRAVHLTNGKKSVNIDRFPVRISGESPIVVLGADRDFELFVTNIDSVFRIHSNGGGIHFFQTFNRGWKCGGTAFFEVFRGFRTDSFFRKTDWISSKIEPDAPSAQDGFDVHPNINHRRPIRRFSCVERPLIALQKYERKHFTGCG